MKSDLDRLMEERGLDAVLGRGKVLGNPPMKYLVGSAGVTRNIIVKKRGENMILIHGVMEREEALTTGLETMDFQDFGAKDFRQIGNKRQSGTLRENRDKRCLSPYRGLGE
jgi:hypothetical protein